jgi:hypothetical protein
MRLLPFSWLAVNELTAMPVHSEGFLRTHLSGVCVRNVSAQQNITDVIIAAVLSVMLYRRRTLQVH